MQAGIEGMLGTLDPYTVYIDKENGDEVDLLTNGKYGGIGVTIGLRDGAVRVISVMDGYSAQRQGILPGDRFHEIDGTDCRGKKPDEIREPDTRRSRNRGEGDGGARRRRPTARVRADPRRDSGEERHLRRMLENGIGYIRLERFSRRAGDEVRQAIKEMKLDGDMKGVVLDLRGNPGGLLDAAVDVVEQIRAARQPDRQHQGRRPEAEKNIRSTEEPVLPSGTAGRPDRPEQRQRKRNRGGKPAGSGPGAHRRTPGRSAKGLSRRSSRSTTVRS